MLEKKALGPQNCTSVVVFFSELPASPWVSQFAFWDADFHDWLCQLWHSFVSTSTASLQRAFFKRSGASNQKDFLLLPWCKQVFGIILSSGEGKAFNIPKSYEEKLKVPPDLLSLRCISSTRLLAKLASALALKKKRKSFS